MSFSALGLAGSALITAALLMSSTASAQSYQAAPGAYHASVHDHDRGRDRAGYPRGDRDQVPAVRHADYRDRRVERCGGASADTILGAIAGGLLGNGGGDRHGNRAARSPGADRDCD
jgi:uncharacterized protein YcfJ